MPRSIKDRDVRTAIETLINEFENKESEVQDLELSEEKLHGEIEHLNDVIVDKDARIEELEEKVKELELALSEAYLTTGIQDGI